MQTRTLLIALMGLFLSFPAVAHQSAPDQDTPPNFVLIFIDDMGYADPGCFGAAIPDTPTIDDLAKRGLRFTSFYAVQAVCSASRAGLMTGCYANRVSVFGALMPWSKNGLHPDEMTIAEVLKQRGYATAAVGKWHLGHHKQFLPLQQGFDEYLGLPYSNDMWPVDFDGTPLTEENPRGKAWKLKYPQLPLIDGDETVDRILDLKGQDTLTTRYTERAVSFIENNCDRPFFLYLAHSMVHVPLGVSDTFRGTSENGLFGDVLRELDWSVSEVVKTLRACGVEDNTLIMFISDNGPWMNFGNHAGSAGPLREGKGCMWEGGARVPCIAYWPGRIEPGREYTHMATTMDVLPTIASLADVPLPERKIDGTSLVPVLFAADTDDVPTVRRQFFYYYGRKLCAVREGKWKLVLPHEYRSYEGVEPGMDGFPGPYSRGTVTEPELYDLEADVGEQNNVAADHPDLVDHLLELAGMARASLGDQGVAGSEQRPAGRAEE
ncbi:MAG: arylsulfatase [Planctomycetes bacterium]|nr:arylsulfatase [Planctomycetota bacterium]NOG55136.1 sulfatase [Planctomycetota bacterium]